MYNTECTTPNTLDYQLRFIHLFIHPEKPFFLFKVENLRSDLSYVGKVSRIKT